MPSLFLAGLLLAQATLAQSVPGFKAAKLQEIDTAITQAISEKRLPGAVVWIERNGQVYEKTYGQRALLPQPEPMTRDTVFDLASLTKVIATVPSLMILVERGKVSLEAPVRTYIPAFTGNGRETVTVRHLMTHTSGLRAGLDKSGQWKGIETALERACGEKLQSTPGTKFLYSDINFILLGEIVHRASGLPLDQFARREVFEPLRMRETTFVPPAFLRARIAPTERSGDGWLRGTVHDPTSRLVGGVAGHAGLFGTASDLARYARMLLNGGELEGVRILKSETVKLMTRVQTPDALPVRRGLGWDIESGYSRRGTVFPLGSFGHTGFTGTSLWIDPFSKTFVIFLSNRVHPDAKGNVLALQTQLGTLAAEAVEGFDFTRVEGALPARTNAVPAATNRITKVSAVRPDTVLNGIDVLVKQNFAPLRKLRIGLITNHTGQDRQRRPTIDLLQAAPEVTLKVLFSPEHGIRGQLDEKVSDGKDEQTGLPVYSLYGERRAPTPEQLADLDALVYDIQDIGCRFYTYISTLGLCLEAAAKAKLKFFVLDRVNPINGVDVEGPVYDGPPEFIAFHALPLRHGMTVGELARMFNAERGWNADLTVIPVENWKRGMWFDETCLPWSHPSPNMRSVPAAILYPGLGLHETAMSVGRGTERPFEIVGAPYVDELALCDELRRARIAGVNFVPIHFTPTYSTFKDQPCAGVAILLTDRTKLNAVDLGVVLAQTLYRLYPAEFALNKISTLLKDPATLEAIKTGRSLETIKQAWAPKLDEFKQRRAPFLLYAQ